MKEKYIWVVLRNLLNPRIISRQTVRAEYFEERINSNDDCGQWAAFGSLAEARRAASEYLNREELRIRKELAHIQSLRIRHQLPR